MPLFLVVDRYTAEEIKVAKADSPLEVVPRNVTYSCSAARVNTGKH